MALGSMERTRPGFIGAGCPGASSLRRGRRAAAVVCQQAAPDGPQVAEAVASSATSGAASVPDSSGLIQLPEETRERALAGNKVEKTKAEKDGAMMWTEIYDYARKIMAGEINWKDINNDDLNVRFKWAGLFHRHKATPGRFMARLKVPNGLLNSEQLRFFGEYIGKYGEDGCGDITTRMNIQLRGILVEDAPELFDGLKAVGLTCFQSGMDNVRNLVGSPIAGIDPLEMYDTRKLCQELDDMVTADKAGNREITNLPRKFNICVSGSRDDFAHTHINDIGLIPMANADGEMGFNVIVGGYMSAKRVAHSIPIDVWVHPDEVVDFCKAMLLVFRDHGARKDRQKARLLWLVEEWGTETFRLVVEERLGHTLRRQAQPGPEYDTVWPRREVIGVHPQKQEGLSWIGCRVPVGRLQAQDFLEIADLADKYSGGMVRLTVEQALLFPNVANEQVETMLAEPLLRKFSPFTGNVMRGLVACTGNQFCGQALIETKGAAVEVGKILEEELNIPELVRIHWTGCPNSCAQVQVADIGLMGTKARIPGVKGPVDGVDIYLGGEIGEAGTLGTMVRKAVPAQHDHLVPVLKEIMIERFNCTEKVKAAAPAGQS